MQLHSLSVKKRKKKKRVGRGGKRGTTAGRGTKGQKARAGHKIRPAIRDLIKRLPKKRGVGFSPSRTTVYVIDFTRLEKNFKNGDKVTPRVLESKGLISLPNQKSKVKIKVLNNGKLTKKLIFENINVSKKAAEEIMALGGVIRHLK